MNSSRREATVAELLTHLNAAYTLARWLVVDPMDAEDAVLEACRQAIRCEALYFSAGVLARFLMLVRNECYARLRRNRLNPGQDGIGKETAGSATASAVVSPDARTATLKDALLCLPLELREVIVLRELHGLPYKDISTIVGVDAHTVMSRLSRVRVMLMESAFPEAGRAVPLALCRVGAEV